MWPINSYRLPALTHDVQRVHMYTHAHQSSGLAHTHKRRPAYVEKRHVLAGVGLGAHALSS